MTDAEQVSMTDGGHERGDAWFNTQSYLHSHGSPNNRAQQPRFDVQMAFECWLSNADSKIRTSVDSASSTNHSYHLRSAHVVAFHCGIPLRKHILNSYDTSTQWLDLGHSHSTCVVMRLQRQDQSMPQSLILLP